VEHAEAVSLIRGGVGSPGGVWADLGAGSGVFTRALGELLGSDGVIYAVDRNPHVFRPQRQVSPGGAEIRSLQADFSKHLDFKDLHGILMANALHFARRHERVLSQIVGYLRDGGRFILVEYDLEAGSPWIPFPVPLRVFRQLAPRVGLGEPREIGRRRSRYGQREIYAAVAIKAEARRPLSR
jgi:ubiquinone/menaquinone biosynthesis C-methylase UbiE